MKRFICLLTALLLCSCGAPQPEPAPAERLVLGFAQTGDESEYRTSSSKDIKRAAEEADIQLMFENAQQKPFNQIKAIRSFILNGVDVIAFSPLVEDGWDNVLLEAKAAGIPVILVDRYIKTEEEGLYCAFIGSDFNLEGVLASEWMVGRFSSASEGDEPVRVAEISGTENSSPTLGRHGGLMSVLGENPGFELAISVSGDFMRSKGKECMQEILRREPDIDVLFAHNDDMALGAIEIMEENGVAPGRDVAVISFDGQKSGLEALKEGKINCIVECNPYVGDELMALAADIVAGREYPAHTYVEERVFTDKDDFSTLPERP
jgi:simple sugar transport system substrate-binding protein